MSFKVKLSELSTTLQWAITSLLRREEIIFVEIKSGTR